MVYCMVEGGDKWTGGNSTEKVSNIDIHLQQLQHLGLYGASVTLIPEGRKGQEAVLNPNLEEKAVTCQSNKFRLAL